MINLKTVIALIGGIGLGAAGASALLADGPAQPKGYVIAEINVTDLEGYRGYGEKAFPVIQQYGGKFLTRGGQSIHVEGAPPAERVMIIEFESFEQAKKFEYSKEYTDIAPLRHSTSESRIFLLEGTADAAKSAP
jgi:uncharacterized protein (DUF1330 family)